MKLINGQKRADFLKAENSKTSQVTADEIKEFPQSYMIAAFSDGVIKGIEFAETELQTLAIEFADWITTAECPYAPIGENINEWVDLSKEGITIIISSKELFQEFIKQRK